MESGIFALLGTLVGGLVTFAIQVHAQRKHDVRSRQKMAYGLAMQEWIVWARARFEQERATGHSQEVPSLSHFVVSHLRFSKLFIGKGVDKLTDKELFDEIQSIMVRNGALLAFFNEEFARRTQEEDSGT